MCGVVAGCDIGAIEREEDAIADMRRALVAVEKRMVARKAEGETRREISQIWRGIPVGMKLLRSCQSRIQQAFVAHPDDATVFGQLTLVDGDGECFLDPGPHWHVPY